MRVSVFTPTHNPRYLLESYKYLRFQDFYEWVIYPNHGVHVEDIPRDIRVDSRVRIVTNSSIPNRVGAIKKFVCSQCVGDILVELDHDDILLPSAIEKVRQAFLDPQVVCVYSDCAEFQELGNGRRGKRSYSAEWGWTEKTFVFEGIEYTYNPTPVPTPFHVSIILYAPNHVRAFRKCVYDSVGGHDDSLSVCDDQDLMCRLYLKGKFYHIPECLYLYRVHGLNTWLVRNAELQDTMRYIQKKYLYQLIEAWAFRENEVLLDLGGSFGKPNGYFSVDKVDSDIVADLSNSYPIRSDSIGVVRAVDFVEHISDKFMTMKEIYRILKPGGYALIHVPSTDGRGAFQDPTHVSFWNENSFWYYTDRRYSQYIRNTSVRFYPMILETYYPSEWHREKNIPYVRADLIALKGNVRPMGKISI